MKLSEKQIEQIAYSILLSDIKSYIETNKQEYEQFLEAERKRQE